MEEHILSVVMSPPLCYFTPGKHSAKTLCNAAATSKGSDLFLQVTLLPSSSFQAMCCSHASMQELLLPSEMAAPCRAASCYSETINSLLVITIMLHLYLVIGEHLLPWCWLEKPGTLQLSLLGSFKGLRLNGLTEAALQRCYCCSAANN